MALSFFSSITDFSLLLMTGILDFVLNFPGRHRCKFLDVMRNILKIIVSAAWAVILPFFYISTAAKVDLPVKELEQWFHYVKGVPPLYLLAVAVYLIPNILSAALFLFPMFRRWIESSDWHIVRLLLWWSQVLNSINYLFAPFFGRSELLIPHMSTKQTFRGTIIWFTAMSGHIVKYLHS